MKKRATWMMIPAVAVSLAACENKKEAVKAPEPASASESPVSVPPPAAPEAPPAAKTPDMSAEERAAKLGFVKHLPQDTEVVMAFHNGSKSAERIKSSRFWQLVETGMGLGAMGPGDFEEMDDELPLPEVEQDADAVDAIAADADAAPDEVEEDPMGPATLFGTEFTLALGKSAGDQSGHLLTLNRRATYFQMRALAGSLAEAVKSGDFTGMESALADPYSSNRFKDLLLDKESGIDLFERMKMPPLYLAFRTTSPEREPAAQQLASIVENLGMFGEEIVESIEVEKGGQKFAGKKISGAKIAESMEADRASLEAMMDSASATQVIAAIAKKDIVVLSGIIGDYVVLFFGSSTDELVFAPDVASSMAGNDSLKFSDPYASKELAAVIYGEKTAVDTMIATVGGLADTAAGIRDGLAGADGLGDTRDLETLLRMVGERDAALKKLATNDSLGLVAFFDEGLRIETYGGSDSGAFDWSTPNTLAPLGTSEDVVIFANMTVDATYDEAARAYMETLFETAYAITMKVADLPIEDEGMVEFKDMAKMFDTRFRSDAVALWDSFNGDFGGGLGHECAWVVDLNGSMPVVPGLPQPVVDEAKFPRISMIAPVTDRSKLATSWEKMNSGTTNILATISEMTGSANSMPKPINSEKDGYTTWFFPLPFYTEDFIPSVTVGDQWFVASTSRNRALDLVEMASKGGETSTGLHLKVNFQALQKFAAETHQVIEKNNEALKADENLLTGLDTFSKAMEDLDELTVHSRREAGVLRSSIHFKTR